MVTGAVGVAAYEALRKMVVKAPLRAATVSVATGFNVDAVRAVAIEETVSIFFDASSTSPPLTRIPSSAPRPVPTMMAVGVRLAPLAGNHIGHPHPGAGEGAGLVEHHGVVRATAVGADTALAQIVRLVEQAHSPSRRRRRVDAHRRIRPGREDGG